MLAHVSAAQAFISFLAFSTVLVRLLPAMMGAGIGASALSE